MPTVWKETSHVHTIESKSLTANESSTHKTITHTAVEKTQLHVEQTAFLHPTVTAQRDVLLKTAVTPLWSDNRSIMTNISLD